MRLIDADALPHDFTVPRLMDSRAYFKGVQDVFETIDAEPTVDAVSVVRCRDCKHAEPIPLNKRSSFNYDRVLVCKNWRGDHDLAQDISVVWDDGYCDEGERKEPADNL